MPALLKTTQIQEPSSATVNLTLDTLGNASFAGMPYGASSFLRNRIINGNMAISQRGTTFTNTTTYTLDRWFVNRNGGGTGVSVSQTGSSSAGYYLKIQRTAADASTSGYDMRQVIETLNCFDLAGKTVTVSATVYKGANYSPSNVNFEIQTSPTADNGVNSAGWTGQGQTAITPTTTATSYSASFTVPAGTASIMVRFSATYVGTAGADDSIYFTNVQLEVGSVATPFERRQYGQEFYLCQRYYQQTYPYGTVPATNTTNGSIGIVMMNNGANNVGNNGAYLNFQAPMRASATITIYPNSGTITAGNVTVAKASTPANNYAFSTTGATSNGFALYSTSAGSGGTAGTPTEVLFQYTASAEL